MLPGIILDDERFEEIVEKARKMIPNLYPRWTDYNDHDPGITMLELFAWLKEIQQFHMDQISPLHLKQYLKLLGEHQKGMIPARTRIWAIPEMPVVLPRGSRFYARDIPFETEHTRFLTVSQIQELILSVRTEGQENGIRVPVTGTSLELPVFNKEMGKEACLYIGLTKPLETGEEHWLYISLSDPYSVRRNPIEGASSFVSLVRLGLEYETAQGFLPVEDWEDGTYGLLENGSVRLRFRQTFKQGFQGLYWLRLVLEDGAYDVPPVLSMLSLHALEARQQKTIGQVYETALEGTEKAEVYADSCLARTGAYECYLETEDGLRRYEGEVIREEKEKGVSFILPDYKAGTAKGLKVLCYEEAISQERLLGMGTGFPNQEFACEIEGLCKEGLKLMVETCEGSGVFRMWQQAEDFTGSVFTDLHYCYDENTGILSFGNFDRGCVPEGRILLAAGHVSLGQGGNIKSGTVSRYEGNASFREIMNLEDAGQGSNPETIEACFRRLHRRLKQTQRAVSYEDYESLVQRTPGLRIESVKAVPVTERKKQGKITEEKKVAVVVKPYSSEPMPVLPEAYLEGILNMLEPRRLIGTRVMVLSPEYIGITVFAEIETDSYYQQTKEAVRQALEGYFAASANRFGQPVLYGTIYGIIDALNHVTQVKSVSLDAQGRGVKRSMNQDVLLPANGLAYLKEWDCMITSAR